MDDTTENSEATDGAATVATEVAEDDFNRWAEEMDLDVDPATMDDEDRASFQVAKGRILKAITKGLAHVNDSGLIVYRPVSVDGAALTFREPDGAVLMSMDKKKSGHDVTKLLTVAAGMTGQSIQRFARMKQRDIRVVQSVVLLFLG